MSVRRIYASVRKTPVTKNSKILSFIFLCDSFKWFYAVVSGMGSRKYVGTTC